MMPRSMYNKTAIISPLNIVLSQVRIQTKTSNGQNTTEGQKEDRDGVEDMLLIGGGEKPHVLKDDMSFMAPKSASCQRKGCQFARHLVPPERSLRHT